MATEQPSATAQSFGNDIVEVCRLLEHWRKEENRLLEEDANELPETNWRVVAQALFFVGAGGLVVFLQSWFRFVQGYGTYGLFLVLLAVCGGASTVLFLHAHGVFDGRFWRALHRSFTKRGNFPFTPLIFRLERDLAALPQLASYSDHVLKAVEERFSSSETRFRDGLTLIGGNSSLPTLAALIAGAWAAWKSHGGSVSVLSMATLAGSVIVLWLSAYALNQRVSLFELTRCRGLMALELARRKAAAT